MNPHDNIAGRQSLTGRLRRDRLSWSWIGVAPFFAFALLFLIIPNAYLAIGAFQDTDGRFTLTNLASLLQPTTLDAYWISAKISVASAIGGTAIGFVMAYAVTLGDLPRWIRPALVTFSGVASNFAGLALAFAFLATFGRVGLVTTLMIRYFDFDIYSEGFNLVSFWGLAMTYLYFQIPLVILILTPALDGLNEQWREAATILGATSWQYWRHIALPVLAPAIVGTTLLLFANAFGAVSTAYGLTNGSLNIVPILLYAQIRGDVLHNANLGYALALGMVLVTGISNTACIWLRMRGERRMR